MNATHIATINNITVFNGNAVYTPGHNQDYKVVIVGNQDGKQVVQQVRKGALFGPTFFADSIKSI